VYENETKLYNIIKKYKLKTNEKNEFLNIIYPIFKHEEFQKRMTDKFKHHGNITLGEHILEDAVLTYILCKKRKRNNVNPVLAVRIAMLHDLYTVPWQNNKDASCKKIFNKHGFRHPIEAVINSINWFPELFINYDEAEILIDGIVHHMYPLPVTVFNKNSLNDAELKNFDLLKNLSSETQLLLIRSSSRHKIGRISLSRSKYYEGRIMAKADKRTSIMQIKNLSSAIALITGHNRSLKK